MRLTAAGVAILALLAGASAARGLTVPALPIPDDPLAGNVPKFIGSPAAPDPVIAPAVPQHPFMAANGRSNLHNDAYQTDAYTVGGPLGVGMTVRSTLLAHECASVTFDAQGRIVTVCVGVEGPFLAMLHPRTLGLMAMRLLPPRSLGSIGGGLFTDVSGGGYFYLDQNDRAVIPTNSRHVLVFSETSGPLGPGFRLDRNHDLTGAVPSGDSIISALPDWQGLIWFASTGGVVGTIDQASGTIRSLELGEVIGNSFAVDEAGGVFMVTEAALYRLEAAPDGTPVISWREPYENVGDKRPSELSAGSGTTPTLMGSDWVAITDHADPINVLVYRRGEDVVGERLICRQPVFEQGSSATEQSLIGAGNSIIVENNFGYSGLDAVMGGMSTSPGLERVDVDADGVGCATVWHSDERAPSVVPKLSLANGLVYTYTKPVRADGRDAWYFTALDFDTGETVYQRLAGTSFGHNNNYAPVTIGPDGTAYVGVLGGLVALRDGP
jgi:hypothetical protein